MRKFLIRGISPRYAAFRGWCNLTIALGHRVSRLSAGVMLALGMILGGASGGAVRAEAAREIHLVALGDSLTAGYGLPEGEGLVPQLQAWLSAEGASVRVENAGVSGDTTAGGLARYDWALGGGADLLMVALGGNDMLRGLPPAQVRANLDAILQKAGAQGIRVVLVGMKAPLNWGPDYKRDFDAIYPELAQKHGAVLIDNLFQGLLAVGADPGDPTSMRAWMQEDGIHPNAAGVGLVVEGIGPVLLQALQPAP